MKNFNHYTKAICILLFSLSLSLSSQKLKSSKIHISFLSTTPIEDILANNYTTVSTLDTITNKVVFIVPMQSFEFEKSLMQKHFNKKKFLNTKAYPKSKLIGYISKDSILDYHKDGVYNTMIKGKMTIKGKVNKVTQPVEITVKDKKLSLNTKFNITLADYGIVLDEVKHAENIAKEVEVTVVAEY